MSTRILGLAEAQYDEYPLCPLCGVSMGLVEAHKRWHINQDTFDGPTWEAFVPEWADD